MYILQKYTCNGLRILCTYLLVDWVVLAIEKRIPINLVRTLFKSYYTKIVNIITALPYISV